MTHLNVQQQQMTATSGAKENSLWPFVRFINVYFYCQQLFKNTSLFSEFIFLLELLLTGLYEVHKLHWHFLRKEILNLDDFAHGTVAAVFLGVF